MRTVSHYLLVLVLFSLASTTYAQSNVFNEHQSTTPPPDARYEIVQSQLAAKWTFRLDRHTGRIHQLVKTQDSGTAWEAMLVLEMPELPRTDKPRFVIFTSGLAARHTFLMDAETGKTWVLTTTTYPDQVGDPMEITGWWPFEP